MQHTLVAVFDNRSDAQNALDELVSSGFSRADVNLSSADPSGQSDSLTGTSENIEGAHEEGIGASIKHFFTGLFGSDHSEHASRYSDAVTSGRHVVTLTTQSEPEVERAADIIERFGPIDIDERHDLTAAQAMSGAAAGGTLYAGAGNTSSAAMSQSMQSGSLGSGSLGSSSGTIDTRPGALQTSASEDRSYFATQNINDPVPKDTTYQEPLGASMQSGGSLDSAVGGNTLSGTQSSSNNPAVSTQLASPGASQSGGLTQGGATLQGTASIPGSDDRSLGGTALQSSQSLQGGSLSGSQQRDVGASGFGSSGNSSGSSAGNGGSLGTSGAQRSGVRVFSRGADTYGSDDDTLFRNDWDKNYSSLGGSYDDYAPAYRYGTESRSKYSGRNWDDVQDDLRSDWDTRYSKSGEPSTWEKFKAAVRHGWDKITPDMDDDDTYYRNHWSGSYGAAGDTYNDYEPAYRYGNEMRSSDKYRGRDWNDVETDLHSDWDTRYTRNGVSTWDKMKAAVRHGWDRMTS